jgi:hypothetical protein
MQRLGVARARPNDGGVVYDGVGPTGLQPLVDSSIEVRRRRALGLDQRGVEIVIEQVQPQDIRPSASPRVPPRRLRRSLGPAPSRAYACDRLDRS